MSKNGRPRALDETKRREICALVSAGAAIGRAAQYVGCSRSTICREAQRDEVFREQLQRARATTLLAPLQAMRQAAQTNWRAAAWMLERSDPEQFGRRQPRSFGPKELRALARDLSAIFDDEIDHPLLRERVAERMQSTINYAMHHAWDKRRTGDSLQKAMEYFADKDASLDNWNPFDFSPSSFETSPKKQPTVELDFATDESFVTDGGFATDECFATEDDIVAGDGSAAGDGMASGDTFATVDGPEFAKRASNDNASDEKGPGIHTAIENSDA